MRRLLKTLGSRNRFSASSLDRLPHMLGSAFMFGHPLLIPLPDVDRTDYFVILARSGRAGSAATRLAAGRRTAGSPTTT
jgi:hypothetical protein